MLSFWLTVSSQETVSFFSKSSPTSTSQVSSRCPKSRMRRLSESAAFVTVLCRRRYIFSRSSSDATSGPSKSLATIRKPPRGNRVIFRTSVSSREKYCILGSLEAGRTHKKHKDQRRNVCNRKILVVHAIERSRRSKSHCNGRR
jgi:hypothetical protein